MFHAPVIGREDLASALDRAGVDEEDYSIRGAYSGRAMYDGTCVAVTLPIGKLAGFLTALALDLAKEGREEEAMDLAERVMTDSAGHDLIVYWPDVTLTD